MHDSPKAWWLLAALLLHGCSTRPESITGTEAFSGLGDQSVFVVSHGWHTGIVVSVEWLTAANPGLKERFGGARYLEIGWGDEAYYQAEQVTFDVLFSAALWPTSSVVHVVEVPVSPADYFANSEVTRLCATEAQTRALATFITNSFARDATGKIIELGHGIYGNSQFYAGSGRFHLFSTCNNWTAKGLRSLGMQIDPTFKLTADSISSYLGEHRDASSQRRRHAGCPTSASGNR